MLGKGFVKLGLFLFVKRHDVLLRHTRIIILSKGPVTDSSFVGLGLDTNTESNDPQRLMFSGT